MVSTIGCVVWRFIEWTANDAVWFETADHSHGALSGGRGGLSSPTHTMATNDP